MTSCVRPTSRQVKASHRRWVYNKLHHPAISPEQGASKIVKISQQVAKLCRKLKWLVFFWDTVYTIRSITIKRHIYYIKIYLAWFWEGIYTDISPVATALESKQFKTHNAIIRISCVGFKWVHNFTHQRCKLLLKNSRLLTPLCDKPMVPAHNIHEWHDKSDRANRISMHSTSLHCSACQCLVSELISHVINEWHRIIITCRAVRTLSRISQADRAGPRIWVWGPDGAKYTVSQKKTRQVWNRIAQNYKDRFWWYSAKIFKIL